MIYSRKWPEIEREWGRSARVLVEDWRDNSTFRTIAAALGVSVRTLQRWRNHWGMKMGGPRKRDEFSCPAHACDVRARALGFESAGDFIRHYKLPPHSKTDAWIADRLRCSVSTVHRHKPDEIVGIWNLSPAGREKLRECGRRNGGHPAANHPWKGSGNAKGSP